jgi:hypothetical protein
VSSKKKKDDTAGRVFEEKWTDDFFVPVKDNPVCLICKESVVVMKEYNMIKTLLSKTFSV